MSGRGWSFAALVLVVFFGVLFTSQPHAGAEPWNDRTLTASRPSYPTGSGSVGSLGNRPGGIVNPPPNTTNYPPGCGDRTKRVAVCNPPSAPGTAPTTPNPSPAAPPDQGLPNTGVHLETAVKLIALLIGGGCLLTAAAVALGRGMAQKDRRFNGYRGDKP